MELQRSGEEELPHGKALYSALNMCNQHTQEGHCFTEDHRVDLHLLLSPPDTPIFLWPRKERS